MLRALWWFSVLIAAARCRPRPCHQAKQRLICINHLPSPDSAEFFGQDVETLEVSDVDGDVVDVNAILRTFPTIRNVSISGGNISKFISPLRGDVHNAIEILQLKRVGVETVGLGRLLTNFPRLESLNLEDNYLQTLTGDFPRSKLEKLYLAGNKWNCSLDLDWIFKLKAYIKDLHDLTCFGEPHSGKSLWAIAHFMKDIKRECPNGCSCTLPKVVRHPNSNGLEPIIEVNCSHRNLQELPLNLPNNTRIVHLESNQIEDLTPLVENRVYRKILDLYLDNNRIRNIEVLEGSDWLRHVRVFSLTGNKLTEVPTYALDNALVQNANMPNAVRISLGGNPWRCDCVFTPVFQEMLQKYAPQIQDKMEVKCSYVEGDENSLLPIIALSRSSVCRSPTEYSVQALDLLNGVLASLILLILGKLGYDYYYFKKTGKLPWIVTKMP